MEFRLTYEGPLLATQRDPVTNQTDKRADHKHAIRRVFHAQLRRLWEITPLLKDGYSGIELLFEGEKYPDVKSNLAFRHSNYGFNFVPLVTQDLNLLCGLEILFLRPDEPGKILKSGDIDNRLKTLFDTLRIPTANEGYSARTASPDEKPFYCLLEDDSLITKISVETDQLLEFTSAQRDMSDVRLVITVALRPYGMRAENMHFG